MKNIGLGLLCLILLVLACSSFYQHRLLKKLVATETTETATNEIPAGDTPRQGPVITDQKPTPTAVHKGQIASADIEDLEAKLDATENELAAAYQELDEDLARNQAIKEKEEALRRQYMSSPAYRNNMRSNIAEQLGDLLDALNLPEEMREAFLDKYTDYRLALIDINMEIPNAVTDAEKDQLRQLNADIRDSNREEMEDFLGADYRMYEDYMELQTTRSILSGFFEMMEGQNQLTEAQENELTQIMYKEQVQVFDEMGYDPRYDIEFPSDVKEGKIDGQVQNMAKIHSNSLEKSEGVLSKAQFEQYKSYLNNMQEMMEMTSKLSD